MVLRGNLGMLVAAVVGGLSCSTLLLILVLLYLKRKKKLNGYQRIQHDLLENSEARRQSRAKSCFDVLCSVQENGKAPAFSIPVTRSKTQPTRTCQVQCSLQYNFHTSVLKIQVVCVVNLPRLFGLQSGVFVKVRLFPASDDATEVREDLGKTATQFRSKNPVFKDFFETKTIPYRELKELMLNLSLYSCDRFSQSHFVGDACVKFADINLSPLEPVIFWRPVQPKSDTTIPKINRSKGQLVVSLRYQKKTGRINVVVMKAINLVTPKRLLRTDPYVMVELLHDDKVLEKKRTQPCRGNLNPVWNEPFVFDWQNDDQSTGYKFVFEIRSSDVFLPDASLGKVELCQGSSEHWKEMTARENYARAMCHEVL